jgi:hypothetical protein
VYRPSRRRELPKQIVPDTAKLDLRFFLMDIPVQVSFYARDVVLPWTLATLELFKDDVRAAWLTDVHPLLSDTLRLESERVEDLGADPGIVLEFVENPLINGGDANPSTPGSLAAYTKLVGTPGGVPRKGGLFIPGLTEPNVQLNNLAGTFRQDLQDALDVVAGDINSGSRAQVIVSRYSGTDEETGKPVPRAEGITNTVDDILVRALVGSQRDRRT